MTSPLIYPGEEIILTSENIRVLRFYFISYLTDKRIILLESEKPYIGSDPIEFFSDVINILVRRLSGNNEPRIKSYPLENIREFVPGMDLEGNPTIMFSIFSSEYGELKDLEFHFFQDEEYRSIERDSWITELLSILTREKGDFDVDPEQSAIYQTGLALDRTQMGIKYCPMCGKTLTKGAQFCMYCGAQIPESERE